MDVALPQLKERCAALQAEIEQEGTITAEIEACDQAELAGMKMDVAEQE